MNAARAMAAAGMLALVVAPAAGACGEALTAAAQHAGNARYAIAYAPVPAPIEAGQLFSLDIVVCPRGGARPPDALRVDAVMPEHRHGMNYRPIVVARGPGEYRAEGLMFHMPGRWDLLFDLVTGDGTERITATRHIE